MKTWMIGAMAAGVSAVLIAVAITRQDNVGRPTATPNANDARTVRVPATDETDTSKILRALDALTAEVSVLRNDTAAIGSRQATLEAKYDTVSANLAGESGNNGKGSAASTRNSVNSDRPVDDYERTEDSSDNETVDVGKQLDRLIALDNTLFALEPDPIWDNAAVGQLTDHLKNTDLGSAQLQGVACRGTLCRIEIIDATDNGDDDMLGMNGDLVPWAHKGRMERIEYDSGGVTTVMYVTREGHAFPKAF